MKPIVIIPARMASTRLPGKPLADIAGVPMIVRVWRQAVAANIGPVVVAAGEKEIAQAVEHVGGRAVLTAPDLPSGSDRVWAALNAVDRGFEHDVVVNLQGDLPSIEPSYIRACVDALATIGSDITTLVTEIDDETDADNSNVTKAIVSWDVTKSRGKAHYFTRARAPWGEGPLYFHIGIYAYTRAALGRFVGLLPSPLEKREKLEQLRALEAGMTIGVANVDSVPLSIDTPADLEKARALFAHEKV
jgi:3-deoxy-manno-octulosonate cytidylyltransferase (CMP-KDO synthetase)